MDISKHGGAFVGLAFVRKNRTIVHDMRTRRGKDSKTLAEVLWPTARRSILALMFLDATREWHLREIARHTSLSPATVHKELKALTDVGILVREERANLTYYWANRDCPVFPELQSLMRKTAGLADVIQEALAEVEGIQVAFIFGSMAKGGGDARSDVDVLIVGEVSFADISAALLGAQERLDREITPTVYSPQEFAQRLKGKHHFLRRVLRGPKIMLIVTSHDLERMGEAASVQCAAGRPDAACLAGDSGVE